MDTVCAEAVNSLVFLWLGLGVGVSVSAIDFKDVTDFFCFKGNNGRQADTPMHAIVGVFLPRDDMHPRY